MKITRSDTIHLSAPFMAPRSQSNARIDITHPPTSGMLTIHLFQKRILPNPPSTRGRLRSESTKSRGDQGRGGEGIAMGE